MLGFLRILSLGVLIVAAIVLGTLWAKLIGTVLGIGGLLLLLVPIPVLGGIFVLGAWIDRYLARFARKQLRNPKVYSDEDWSR